MKKILSISVLLVLSLMFIITGTSYYYKIKRIKRAIKKELAAGNIDEASIVVFSSSQIINAEWVEPKEFRWNNNMYDVFKTDTCEGEIWYHTFLDNEETTWANLFIAYCKNQPPISSSKDNNPLKNLMKDLLITPIETIAQTNDIIKMNLPFCKSFFYYYFSIHIHTPPPEG